MYTFHNSGSITSFNPRQTAKTQFGQPRQTMLEMYTDLVRTSGRRDVFILDNKGNEVVVEQAAAA